MHFFSPDSHGELLARDLHIQNELQATSVLRYITRRIYNEPLCQTGEQPGRCLPWGSQPQKREQWRQDLNLTHARKATGSEVVRELV